MGAPFNDIGINPFTSDRRGFLGAVATVATIKYGMVVIGDTGTTNARDVKLPAGANATLTRGIVADHGDPNNAGLFAVGDEFSVCYDGVGEALLDAGATATKDTAACTSATAGTLKNDTGTGDVVGIWAQTYDNSGGAAAVLVAIRILPHPR
jgi:hypothetical protein